MPIEKVILLCVEFVLLGGAVVIFIYSILQWIEVERLAKVLKEVEKLGKQ